MIGQSMFDASWDKPGRIILPMTKTLQDVLGAAPEVLVCKRNYPMKTGKNLSTRHGNTQNCDLIKLPRYRLKDFEGGVVKKMWVRTYTYNKFRTLEYKERDNRLMKNKKLKVMIKRPCRVSDDVRNKVRWHAQNFMGHELFVDETLIKALNTLRQLFEEGILTLKEYIDTRTITFREDQYRYWDKNMCEAEEQYGTKEYFDLKAEILQYCEDQASVDHMKYWLKFILLEFIEDSYGSHVRQEVASNIINPFNRNISLYTTWFHVRHMPHNQKSKKKEPRKRKRNPEFKNSLYHRKEGWRPDQLFLLGMLITQQEELNI